MSTENQLILTGASKDGGDQRAPVDHAATLFSRATAQIIDLLCEGEIFGLLDQTFPAKSIYFDEVRVQNDDGSFNFEGVTIQTKVGAPSQTAVQGFDEVESSVGVNQEITDIASPQFTITETSIDAIRIILQVPSLMIQNTSNGDLLPHTVGIKIEVSENHAGGVFTEILTNEITGKTKSAYQRAYRIDLSSYTTDAPSDYPLIFKVSRTTPEAVETTTQDQIFVDSYIEIQEQKFEYPDSAYVALTVDSELFGGKIPKRSYEIKGLKIQHPSNYDPDTRVYTGIWDGTFSEGYCNNPAWVMYDMLTNSRYGLGDDIDTSQVDKAALYQIGIYCDELVDDGKGGTEPRFTLNAVITQRKEAYTVLNAIASVFRGMAFWSAGGVSFSNDQPKDAVRVVTNASVKDGDFTYSGVGLKARHSAVLVTWNDPLDFYRQQIEVVEDADLIQRFGWRQIELVAFGTTSRAQAIRMGKWLLQAEATETETVTYEAGWDHADTTPGQIIQISDEHRVGARIAGRILAKNLHSLTTAIPTDSMLAETTFTSVTTYVDTGVESDADAVFKCSINIPSAIVPEGLIFEAGDNTSSGAYVGFDSAGSLIFRAGDGDTSPDVATSARIAIPYASLAKDQDLDIVWDYRVSPGRIRVWINNQYIAEQGTSAGAPFLGSAWANTNGAGYGTIGGAATVLGEAGDYTQNVQLSGVILKSSLEYWRAADAFTPLQPHTVKESFSDGDTITSVADATAGGMDRDTNAVISCAIKTPAAGTVPVGIIAELGKGTADADEAFYLGFDGTGDLVVHAGAGGASPDTAEAARIVVPASEWVADTWYNLTVQLLPATGEVGLWINHTFREWAQTSDLGPFQDGRWADTDSGGYGLAGTTLSTSDLTGNFNLAFNGTLTGTLDYYRDVELTEAQNAFSAGTLTLDQEWTVEPGDSIVVVVADNAPDIVPLVPGTGGADVTLRGRTRKDVPLNAVFFIQGAVSAQEWTVLNNREADTHQYQITALRYDRTKFARVEEGIVIEPERTSLLPTGTLLPPTNLNFDESLYVANGRVHTRINLSWTPSTDARVRLYRVEYELIGGNNRSLLGITGIPNITIQPAEEGVYSFWVTSISNGTGASHIVSTAELLSQTVFGKSSPPANVENLTASRGFTQVTLSWDQVSDLDRLGYTIKEGTDWSTATTIVEEFAGTRYSIEVDTSDVVTYLIKAVDTSGNESLLATPIATSIQVLDTVTSLVTYQRLHNIRITWAASTGVANVQYEIRHGGVSWETARLLNRVATPYLEAPFSVAAETTSTIRIKPFVELASGSRHYGPETTVSHTQHPIINGYRIKRQAEHTAWTSVGATLIDRFLASGPDVTTTFADGDAITALTQVSYTGAVDEVVSNRNALFHANITVSSTSTPEGCLMEAGGSGASRAAYVGFNATGDLICRAATRAGTGPSNNLARVLVAYADLPKDTPFDLLWEWRVGDKTAFIPTGVPGRTRLWVNGTLSEADTGSGNAFEPSASNHFWCSNTPGRYNGINGTTVTGETGAFDSALNAYVTLNGDLSYWRDQLLYDPLEISAGELTLTAESDYGQYIFDFDFLGRRKGRMWVEYNYSSVAAAELDIDDAQVLIDNANMLITETFSEDDPQVAVLIQLDGAGDYVPFEEGSYEFTTAKFKLVLTRGSNDTTKPLLEDFAVYFHNDGDRVTLQNQTTDATPTDITTDGETAAVENTVTLTDDNTSRFEGTLLGRKSDNSETAKYFIEGTLTRGTGAASVVLETSQLTVLHEDDDTWDVTLSADTTLGGLAVKVTGAAGTTIDWVADIFVREFG